MPVSFRRAVKANLGGKLRREGRATAPQRRLRIAAGSGVKVAEVNTLMNKFGQMQKMMKKFGKMQKMMGRMGGKMPGMRR